MHNKYRIIVLYQLILLPALLFIATGCGEEETIVNKEFNQYSHEVESIPEFNGASCLVCIDVSLAGSTENLDWAIRANRDSTVGQWSVEATETAILREIRDKIAGCPEGSRVKLQFLYHLDPKLQYHWDNERIRQTYGWNQYLSVEKVLEELAQSGNDRISKVYLTSCNSQERTSTVNAAFGITSVTHVVTVDNTILLNCGEIAGATYPTFRPAGVNIIVWHKEGDRQIANIPEDEMGADQKFDIGTNTVTDR